MFIKPKQESDMTESPSCTFKQQEDEMCVGIKKRLHSGYSSYIRGGVWVFGLHTSVLYNSANTYINYSRLTHFRDFTFKMSATLFLKLFFLLKN